MSIVRKKICFVCGKEFETKSSKSKFCSYECKHRDLMNRRPLRESVCEYCGKSFKYVSNNNKKRFYCSVACQLRATVPTKVCTCVDCGTTFTFVGRTTRLRCDTCRDKHRSLLVMRSRVRRDPTVRIGVGSGHNQGQDLASYNPEREELNAIRREQYRKDKAEGKISYTYKYRCILSGSDHCDICGYSSRQDALVVHHLDMNRANNDPKNLVIICSNCHACLHKFIRKKQKTIEDFLPEDGYIEYKEEYRKAELKERNEAGTPDRETRTEPQQECCGGAERSGTSRTDMNHQEAAPQSDLRKGTPNCVYGKKDADPEDKKPLG